MIVTKRQNMPELPYSLHDARVNRIALSGDQITLYFDEGYYRPVDDDCLPVKGYITLEHVDFDFCHAYLLDIEENDCEKFSGERFALQAFAARFPKMDFEIIDETYGYNQSKFTGFFYEGKNTRECMVEIYHFGAMTYYAEA